MHVLVHLITSESRSNLEEGQREQQGEGKKNGSIGSIRSRVHESEWLRLFFRVFTSRGTLKDAVLELDCVRGRVGAASVRLGGLLCRVGRRHLGLVDETQQEEGYVVWAPVARVRRHRRPIAALHQALPQLEVHAALQLHWKTQRGASSANTHRPTNATVWWSGLTWCLVCGRSGPSHGGQAVRRLALRPLFLLLLRAGASLQPDGHGGLAVGAGEAREEDAADAFADTRRSCDEGGERRRVSGTTDGEESSHLYSLDPGCDDVTEFKERNYMEQRIDITKHSHHLFIM